MSRNRSCVGAYCAVVIDTARTELLNPSPKSDSDGALTIDYSQNLMQYRNSTYVGLLMHIPKRFSCSPGKNYKRYLSKFLISLLFSKFHFWSITAPHGYNVAISLTMLYNNRTDAPLQPDVDRFCSLFQYFHCRSKNTTTRAICWLIAGYIQLKKNSVQDASRPAAT
jgi:hypothetical protein